MVRLVMLALLVPLGGCGPAMRAEAGRSFGFAPRLVLAAAPSHVAVPYERLLDARGAVIDGDELRVVATHPETLEALQADATRGDARAVRVMAFIELQYQGAGREMARIVSTPPCLFVREVPSCHPDWTYLGVLGDGPGAKRLQAMTFEAYEARLRQLEKQRTLTEASVNLLMAGMVWTRTAAAVEGAETGAMARAPLEPLLREGLANELRLDLPSLVDVESGASPEVLEAKLAEAEALDEGPRLPAELPLLEKLRPVVERPPPGVAAGDALWREYTAYYEKRLGEMKQARQAGAAPAKAIEPPRPWSSYQRMRVNFARGVRYERKLAAKIRAEANLPPEQRIFTKGFKKPHVELNVGVKTEKYGLRYVDVLIIEEESAPGQPLHVESCSVKSRDLTHLKPKEWELKIDADIRDALRYYGGELEIRRPSLRLRGQKVNVSKVRLIYDGELRPKETPEFNNFAQKQDQSGVEIHFE